MIAFCAECGAHQGWGHLMRSLAIADQVRALGGAATFHVMGDVTQAAALVGGRHPLAAVARHELRSLAATGARAVLVDGYGFTEDDEATLAAAGLAVAVMDDLGQNPHRPARLIVNCDLHYGRPELYAQAKDARLLLGPPYAPLRAGLATHRETRRTAREDVARILVVLGGSDAAGVLDAVLDALTASTAPHVRLVVAAQAREASSRPWAAHAHRLEWVRDPDALAREMTRSDLAVSAGGMTSYELAFMGTPMVLLPATPVQAPVSADLARRGCAVLPEPALPPATALQQAVRALAESPPRRQAMADAGQAIFDGQGARRIASALLELETSR